MKDSTNCVLLSWRFGHEEDMVAEEFSYTDIRLAEVLGERFEEYICLQLCIGPGETIHENAGARMSEQCTIDESGMPQAAWTQMRKKRLANLKVG